MQATEKASCCPSCGPKRCDDPGTTKEPQKVSGLVTRAADAKVVRMITSRGASSAPPPGAFIHRFEVSDAALATLSRARVDLRQEPRNIPDVLTWTEEVYDALAEQMLGWGVYDERSRTWRLTMTPPDTQTLTPGVPRGPSISEMLPTLGPPLAWLLSGGPYAASGALLNRRE